MKHEVVIDFKDKLDKNAKGESRPYKTGDPFPATKRKVAEERLEELKGSGNAAGQPVIKEITEEEK